MLVLVPIFVVGGIGLAELVGDRLRGARGTWAITGLCVLVLIHAVVVAPYGLAYFNPALGGSEAGSRTLLVGWGEGRELAAARIKVRSGDDCDGTTVQGLEALWILGWDCTRPPPEGSDADYVVLYVNVLQRSDGRPKSVDDRELVDVIEIRGISYAEIWR